MNIIEGNRLIAKFDSNASESFGTWFYKPKQYHFDIEDAEYHTNWNWIMPVIEQIEKDNYGFKMYRKGVEVCFDDSKGFILDEKQRNRLESLWCALVTFITYYNNNNLSHHAR